MFIIIILVGCTKEKMPKFEIRLPNQVDDVLNIHMESTSEFPKECLIRCKDYNFTMKIDVEPKYDGLYIPFNPSTNKEDCNIYCD